ncbi:MAG: CoA transferase [Actinobacteria bacterium]|nr:CoA transferase [Ilumatobacteraceae bacterium]MDA0299500.1 CoA transferase [Actinomycetota bacterium]MDA2994724.1 CoA transferase [Actinomycetota bacterium]
MAAPLDGIVVLDFSRVLAGPHCGRALADLGARVIKIEPPAGDLTRFCYPRRNSISSYFAQQNTGKDNISLDLTKPEATDIILGLVEHADVVIENFRPGVMKRLGLDYERLAAIRPELVYASSNGYGTGTSWEKRRAYAPVIGAETGLIKSQGDARDGRYFNDRHSHADVYTALELTVAVLAALNHRHATGRGQQVEVTMAQTMLYVNEHTHDALWDEPVPEGVIRSFQPGDYQVLQLGDGSSIIVSGHPAEAGTFEFFMRAIGREDAIDDPRFADIASRRQNLADINQMLADHAETIPDAVTYEEILSKHNLAVGQLRTVREFAESEWSSETGAIVEVSDRGDGVVKIPQAPWKFSDGPDVGIHGSPRYRGEDNHTVLNELLGLDEATLQQLEENGILSSHVPRR